jgi:membrane fusion protein (multidrug efflux system)
VHASYGDSVFVVEDGPTGKAAKVARQQFVRLGGARGDYVAILDGVKAGQLLVTAGAFKLRNGSPVVINNDIKNTPALQPHVDNL